MATHYLGTAKSGQIVSRKSTRSDFTHAAIATNGRTHTLPNFSTSAAGAEKLFVSGWINVPEFEIVPLRIVDAAEFRAATKGISPHTGRPLAARGA